MKWLYFILLVAALAGAACTPDNDRAPPQRPNIILLMADDVGWGDAGYQGHETLQTPNIDAMAAKGLILDRFYAAAPVCSPTRASVLTGRHPNRSGIFFALMDQSRNALPQDEVTLAEVLRADGYRTAFFGKWHLGGMSHEIEDGRLSGIGRPEMISPPWQHGFDRVFATESRVPTYDPMIRPALEFGEWEGPKSALLKEPTRGYWEPVWDPEDAVFFGTRYWHEDGTFEKENLGGDDSRVIMDRVEPFIRESAASDQPFFAVVWFHTAHLPVVAGIEDQYPYRNESFYDRLYHGAISGMDREIGRLRSLLKETGQYENTVLWFTSDNGPETLGDLTPGSAGGLRGRKRSLFEGGIRVPGVIEWPARIKAGSRTATPAVTSDIFPTVLAWAGVQGPVDRPMDGEDLAPVIDEGSARSTPIMFESRHQLALIDGPWKIVHQPNKKAAGDNTVERDTLNTDLEPQYSLFNIEQDPAEAIDLAEQHPEVVKR
ncbi:MAG: sulfatase-like hydrolase/transferase, partial [candidate division NC10 bacterium]